MAGVKLDVKPWDFLSSIAQNAAREWFSTADKWGQHRWGHCKSTIF